MTGNDNSGNLADPVVVFSLTFACFVLYDESSAYFSSAKVNRADVSQGAPADSDLLSYSAQRQTNKKLWPLHISGIAQIKPWEENSEIKQPLGGRTTHDSYHSRVNQRY